MISSFKQRLLGMNTSDFEQMALEAFAYQSEANPVYRQYLRGLKRDFSRVTAVEQIPFMPIEFYKTHRVLCQHAHTDFFFESSGTTGQTNSRHYMADLAFYEAVAERIFEQFYGPLAQFHILALLPSYLERNNASLVQMARQFIEKAQQPSGFFLHNYDALQEILLELTKENKRVLLIGVTFALLDLAEIAPLDLSSCILMETGGMKGRRREMVREEVHEILTSSFHLTHIHSEYGMTELTSQGYSKGEGIFELPPWMHIYLRDMNDPLSPETRTGRPGGINVVDLANIDSCCFIETKDIGRYKGAGFEVLGRFDNADVRGCNLMAM